MTEHDVDAELTEIFHDLFGDDALVLSPEMTAQDIHGWDSIKHISLIVAIEQRFGVKWKTSEIESLRNVGDLERTIRAKLAAKGA